MCVTSMVIDNGYKYFQYKYNIEPLTFKLDKITPELQVEFLQFVNTLKSLVKEAEKYDEVTGQPDCIDPNKEKFMQTLEELEKAILNANSRT